jgi:hypothetical protein
MTNATTFEPAPASAFAPQAVSFYSAPDPASFLPAGTPAHRFQQLVRRVDDLRKLLPDFEERHQASLDKFAAEARVFELTRHKSDGGFGLPDDAPQVVAARRELADKAAEQKRINELYDARSKALQSCGGLLSNVRAWLADGRPRGTSMESITVPTPRLQKAETITAAITRLQQQANEVRASITEVENAPLPGAYARARLRQQFETIAKRGEVGVEHFLYRENAELFFPETRISLQVHTDTPAPATGPIPDAIGMLFNACPALLDVWDKKLGAAAVKTESKALAPEEKQKQIAQLSETLFAVELDLATLMFDAWRDGQNVEVPLIGPAALLAVRNNVVPRAMPPSGTTGDHAYSIIGPR